MHEIKNLKTGRHTPNMYTCTLSTGLLYYFTGNAEIYLPN